LLIGPRGTVISYSIQRYQPPEPYPVNDPYEPVVIATVAFEEAGLQIPGALINVNPDDIPIGLQVDTVVDVLRTGSDGTQWLTWRFSPPKSATSGD
jgi:uncharacterized OB-fold protein